jgi:hypothetical protein
MSDVECEIRWEDVNTFNWKELHGKQVYVIVVEDSGVQSATLYDSATKEFFVVSIKKLEEMK